MLLLFFVGKNFVIAKILQYIKCLGFFMKFP